MKRLFIPLCALSLAGGCVDIDIDDEEAGPVVEFDPSNSIVPLPNSLLFDPGGSGRLDLPAGCNESSTEAAIRVGILNQLDGFGTFKPAASITFTSPVDPATLTDRIKLFQRTDGATAIDPLISQEVPLVFIPGVTARDSADCSSTGSVPSLTIVPAVPLEDNSTYTYVVLSGIEDENGDAYLAAPTWALIRQSDNPVVVENGSIVSETTPLNPAVPDDRESLLGIDQLWKLHAGALSFLDEAVNVSRDDILLAWDFKTQTITDPLDLDVTGSLAANLPTTTPLLGMGGTPGMNAIAAGMGVPPFIEGVLGAPGACMQLPCAAIGTVFSGAFASNNYLLDTPNPLTGGDPVPAQWPDPLAPAQNGIDPVTVSAILPAGSPPPGGWPVVVFGHGFTRSRGDIFAIGSQLAAAGIATVSLDWVAHGDPTLGGRAIQVNDQGLCAGTPDPTDTDTGGITCFAPSLSSNLAADRDYIRQSVLDTLALINALKLCSADTCGTGFNLDPNRIGYISQSLGSMIGSVVVPMSPDIKTAVLNVGGVGIIDIIENTRPGFLCPLVDALIDAGVLSGDKSNLTAMPPTGLCLTDTWKTNPAWLEFANIARWIVDPADGANFADRLVGRPILLQEVVGDDTVSNGSTQTWAALLGLTPTAAAVATSPTPAPTSAITGGVGSAHYVQYDTVPANLGMGFPGNAFWHFSLLGPPDDDPDTADIDEEVAGTLGLVQMQTDAVMHLCLNFYGLSCPLLP